jgi:cell division septation protein DedD
MAPRLPINSVLLRLPAQAGGKKTAGKSLWLLVLFFLFTGSQLFAQAAPALFSVEIAALEKKAADSGVSPPERKQALEKMARLLELSGNMERAAEAWKKAAVAVPGASEDLADLLHSSRCFAAIGEFDKADAALKPLFASSDKALLIKARLLGAWIEAFRTGRTEALNALLSNPDFADYKPGIYYTIWRISGDSAVKAAMAGRLLAEFPQSPETRIVRGDVSASPAALWLLSGASQPVPINQPVSTSPPVPTGPSVTETPIGPDKAGGPVMLQTGLFSREENARALADRLRNAGFTPAVSQRMVNGKEHWAVGVQPGPDPSRTALLLKDKGFESFPVY